MTIEDFVRQHREELDEIIQRVAPGSPRTDDERELWVMNDEGLANWAENEGVTI